jgi:hypothetical protein
MAFNEQEIAVVTGPVVSWMGRLRTEIDEVRSDGDAALSRAIRNAGRTITGGPNGIFT